jgi:hypothetical protein
MEKEVKNQLDTKMKDLMLFCMKHRIPMFATFADEKNGETKYESTVVTPYELGMKLSEDKITKFSAALNKHFELRFKTQAKMEDSIDAAIDDLISE